MMGHQTPPDDPLFSYNVHLETRVRKDHPLRRIKERIDFDVIYEAVEETYGTCGHVSVPPPVILKLMLLLVLYNVRSERELMETLPERLALVLGLYPRNQDPGSQRPLESQKEVGRRGIPHVL
jgi:transposase